MNGSSTTSIDKFRSSQASDQSGSSTSPNSFSKNKDDQFHIQGITGSSRTKNTLADAIATTQGTNQQRKRKRVHYSCAECHRRKHKCDREIPCKSCVDRGLADSCRPFSEGDEFGDERDRIKRLEDVVEGLAKAYTNLAEQVSKGQKSMMMIPATVAKKKGNETTAVPLDVDKEDSLKGSNRTIIERQELRSSADESVDNVGNYANVEGTIAEHDSLEGGLTREGDSFYGALALPSVSRGIIETQINGEKLELGANIPLRSASVKVHRLIQEGGASENVIEDLMECLPSRETSDEMLEWYFRDINDTRLPLHEKTFRASYEEIMQWRWGTIREKQGDDGARHIPFLSFLFIILAIAKRSEPEDRCSDQEARRGSLFFLHCARRSMATASVVRADHIDVLLAALFGARLLIILRQSAESWSLLGTAIRAAQAIGLHRDGTKLGLDAVTTERRRRLWALIYYLDRTTAMLLGRPQAIDDRTTDVLPPSDVDIDTLPRMGPAPLPEPFPPISAPTLESLRRPPGVYKFVAIRHELARLTGRVVDHFQDLSRPRIYSEVLKIDTELETFYAAIPPPYLFEALRGKDADESFDKICPWVTLHRYLLNLEYHYVRITLHRPYLLRSSKYRQSREAAFASAKADRLIRKEYKKQVTWPSNRARNAHLGGVYRLFSSTLIAGIELLLDPNGSNALELHEMLDDFIDNAIKSADPSQCTKRELAIIKIFKAKAMDPSWRAATTIGGAKQKEKKRESPRKGTLESNSLTLENSPALVESSSQQSENKLAQTLLDRLGGLETFGVLNQSQPPSNNVSTSHELGSIGVGMNMGLVSSTNEFSNSSNEQFGNSASLGLNVPDLDTLFDPMMAFDGQDGDVGDWSIFTNAAAGDPWTSASGTNERERGSTDASQIIDGKEFGGWEMLVEAIASGKEGG